MDEIDASIFGWPDDLTDEEILERLLALNFARAETQGLGNDANTCAMNNGLCRRCLALPLPFVIPD